MDKFLLTPLREGRPPAQHARQQKPYFYSRPCGRGDRRNGRRYAPALYFYSRPCGRGDGGADHRPYERHISTHAPAGGATTTSCSETAGRINFYSRPCGRGDPLVHDEKTYTELFLLTPLREGRPITGVAKTTDLTISTHAPAGGATRRRPSPSPRRMYFYSRPCGRGDGNFPQVRYEVLRQIAER